MLARVDYKELRELGWRKQSAKIFTFPKRPRSFELEMRLRGHHIKEIVAMVDGSFEGERIFTPSRGFIRARAKRLLSSADFKAVYAALEALHDRFAITL
jgi:hypothetical protein